MSNFVNTPARLDELNDKFGVDSGLSHAELTYVSAVWVKSLDDPRLQAVENSLCMTMESGTDATHLVILDDRSTSGVERCLRDTGAVVVSIDGKNEGGLVNPYNIGIMLVQMYGMSDGFIVKVEGEKAIGSRQNTVDLLHRLRENDVVLGTRSRATWVSMPDYQQMTEAPLSYAIADLLDVPPDVTSGVIGFGSAGAEIFLNGGWESWEYLMGVPFRAAQQGLKVAGQTIDWRYPQMMVEQENTDPTFPLKRVKQAEVMIDKAEAMARAAGLPAPTVESTMLRQLVNSWEEELLNNA